MGRWYRAADVSGTSIETVRRWAVHYYLSLVRIEPSASVKKPYSLIKSDDFCSSARKFVNV